MQALLGGLGKTHGAALNGSHAVVDDFDTGVLFIVEAARERIAEHQEIDALPFKISLVVQDKALLGLLLLSLGLPGLLGLGKDGGQRKQRGQDDEEAAIVHADDPYSAELTAICFMGFVVVGSRSIMNVA